MVIANGTESNNRLLEAALAYAGRGWRVIPLHHILPDGKCSCKTASCKRGKHPRIKDWPNRASSDAATIRSWWTSWPEGNIGLACGPGSDVLALDIEAEGLHLLADLEQRLGPLPRTVTSRTGGGGQHRLFQWPTGCVAITNKVRVAKVPIDIRAKGGQIVLPPSRNGTGVYNWQIGPDDAPLAELPKAWVDWINSEFAETKNKSKAATAPPAPTPTPAPIATPTNPLVFTVGGGRPEVRERVVAYLNRCPPAISGQGGHNTTMAVARAVVWEFDLGANEGFELLKAHYNPRCQPPWSDAELMRKCQEADKAGYGKPRGCLLHEDNPKVPSPSATPTPASGRPGEGETDASGTNEEDIEGIELPPPPPWPTLPEGALVGLPGEIVRAVEPTTEADPVAVLVNLLVMFGSVVGRHAHFDVGADRHYTNLFAGVLGTSAHARKTTATSLVKRLLAPVDHAWGSKCINTGLSSGEGLKFAVRDPVQRINEDGEVETVQEGVTDKRLLVIETEFASVLQSFKRQANTLSAVLRAAWDDGDLQTLTRGDPIRATGAHISFVFNCTIDELAMLMRNTPELVNGFSNRCLWCLARRSKELPEPPPLDAAPWIERLRQAVAFGRNVERLVRDNAASRLWREVYSQLNEEKAGVYGKATSRAAPQVLRLSTVYALMNGSPIVRRVDLEAALAVWNYCDTSAQIIFGAEAEDPLANMVLDKLRAAGPAGMTRTELRNAFGRNVNGGVLLPILVKLRDRGLIERLPPEPTAGRPRERWRVKHGRTTKTTEGGCPPPGRGASVVRSFGRSVVRHADGQVEVTL